MIDDDKNLYDILGVQENAADYEIEKRYKELARIYHPDVNLNRIEWAKEKMQELNYARSVLSDSSKRMRYTILLKQKAYQEEVRRQVYVNNLHGRELRNTRQKNKTIKTALKIFFAVGFIKYLSKK